MARLENQPAQYIEIGGQKLTCPFCGNDRFRQRKVLLNTALATFFKFDWANRRADCYVCTECGRIEWFA